MAGAPQGPRNVRRGQTIAPRRTRRRRRSQFLDGREHDDHSAFSKRSHARICPGMLSLLHTTPLSSRRFLLLVQIPGQHYTGARVRHAAATRYFFIVDLQGHTAFLDIWLRYRFLAEELSTRCVRRGYASPDSPGDNLAISG